MGFTNEDVLRIAMEQSAQDAGCRREDFLRRENVVVLSKANPQARKYLDLPLDCNLISYGQNVVASVRPEYRETVEAYLGRFPMEHCFETPNLHVLNDAMEEKGRRVCFMAEYFLPDMERLRAPDCFYPLKILEQLQLQGQPELYTPWFSNALCEKRKQLDVLAVGAYEGEKLIGLAGASADCETMWQIGVDVLPDYRRRGVAWVLTSRLALEILKRGKIPFYCAAWSNLPSVRNALKSGFRPSWVEMTVKSASFVAKMNGQEE